MEAAAAHLQMRHRMVLALTGNVVYAAAMAFIAVSLTPHLVGVRDWVLHGLAFGLQVGLLSRVTCGLCTPLAAVGCAAAGSLLCGTVIEFLQTLVFGCRFEAADLLADAVGVGLAAAVLLLATASRARPTRKDLT